MVPRIEPPLGPDEAAAADRVARRLHDEVRELVAALPAHARGASAMSRHLDLDRATCQRVVAATKASPPDRHLLARIPGVQGLRQFLDALVRSGVEEGATDSAAAALEQYRELLEIVGGSQSRLAARLEAGPGPGTGAGEGAGDDPTAHHRSALFEAAAALTGRSTALSLTFYAYRPDPADADRVEAFTVTGMIGHVASPQAVPLMVMAGSHPLQEVDAKQKGFRTLDHGPAHGRTPRAVLEEFSTSPVPVVTSRDPRGLLVQVMDPSHATETRPVDLVTAHRPASSMPHPRTESPPVQEAWSLQNFPARHLVFDVFLHRDLARACIPQMDLHLWLPSFEALIGQRWATRFPHAPRLEVLGPGGRGARTPHYPRYEELLERAFGLAGWPLEEFVGHRSDVAWPLWRGGYCMSFDFSPGEPGE